jgi:hypothetical protein
VQEADLFSLSSFYCTGVVLLNLTVFAAIGGSGWMGTFFILGGVLFWLPCVGHRKSKMALQVIEM